MKIKLNIDDTGINYFEKRELIEIGLAAMHPVAPVGVRASRGSASAAATIRFQGPPA
jgi:hypothetical protein